MTLFLANRQSCLIIIELNVGVIHKWSSRKNLDFWRPCPDIFMVFPILSRFFFQNFGLDALYERPLCFSLAFLLSFLKSELINFPHICFWIFHAFKKNIFVTRNIWDFCQKNFTIYWRTLNHLSLSWLNFRVKAKRISENFSTRKNILMIQE